MHPLTPTVVHPKHLQDMKRNHIPLLITLLILPLLPACDSPQETPLPPLKVGTGQSSLSHITLHRDAESGLIISGGNGKYDVHIADRSIATATIHHDTLRVRGHIEGETHAVIHSSGARLTIPVIVEYPRLSISHSEVLVYPDKDIKRSFVTLTGGDPRTTLTEVDPYDIIEYKWNGANSMLEFYALYEGNARIIATDGKGTKQELEIKVRAEEDPSAIGVYNTNARYSNNPKFQARLHVEKIGQNTLLSKDVTPYPCIIRKGYGIFGKVEKYGYEVYSISNLSGMTAGEERDIEITNVHGEGTNLPTGTQTLLVDKIKDGKVTLLGNRYKIFMPLPSN